MNTTVLVVIPEFGNVIAANLTTRLQFTITIILTPVTLLQLYRLWITTMYFRIFLLAPLGPKMLELRQPLPLPQPRKGTTQVIGRQDVMLLASLLPPTVAQAPIHLLTVFLEQVIIHLFPPAYLPYTPLLSHHSAVTHRGVLTRFPVAVVTPATVE